MGCHICPRNCDAKRSRENPGYCGAVSQLYIARAGLHQWEEPCICGGAGSGTVFFSGCPLRCVFCQNHLIAENGCAGKSVSDDELVDIFFELQEKGACNINLVTATHFVPQIVPALRQAKRDGLAIPVVYNTGSYEKVETLRMLEGLVDIYLPDLKYVSSRLSLRYSNAEDYFSYASEAIREMFRQVGAPVFDSESRLMKSGVIVRHLMLPSHLTDSKRVLSYLHETYNDNIYISIMNQYTPIRHFEEHKSLNRRVSHKEYNALIDYCLSIGIENAFIQEGETASESFIPDFDLYHS